MLPEARPCLMLKPTFFKTQQNLIYHGKYSFVKSIYQTILLNIFILFFFNVQTTKLKQPTAKMLRNISKLRHVSSRLSYDMPATLLNNIMSYLETALNWSSKLSHLYPVFLFLDF